MFHQIIFLLLIVSSLSWNFDLLYVLFVFIVHEHRLQEYSKNVARIKRFIRLHIVITETIK